MFGASTLCARPPGCFMTNMMNEHRGRNHKKHIEHAVAVFTLNPLWSSDFSREQLTSANKSRPNAPPKYLDDNRLALSQDAWPGRTPLPSKLFLSFQWTVIVLLSSSGTLLGTSGSMWCRDLGHLDPSRKKSSPYHGGKGP